MSWLEERWWRADAPSGLAPLAPAEALFAAGAGLRDALFRAGVLRVEAAGAPVISIGNLAVGGAGKTPAAIAVARRLQARGRQVAVLSRGYGAARADARVVSDGARVLLDAAAGGDEPAVIARSLPGARVLCGPRRAELARWATDRLGADALVLDDGFQHRALARDLDVVVVDAANPVGNGRLLPRGPNREPWSALRRAGLAWLSRADRAAPGALERLREDVRSATGREPVESVHQPVAVVDGALERDHGLDALRGRRVLALSALARPEGFHRTLRELGAELAAAATFQDHHRWTAAELDAVAFRAERDGLLVATTEKDAVRLPPAWAARPALRVVRIEARITRGEALLDSALDAALAAGDARRARRADPSPARTR